MSETTKSAAVSQRSVSLETSRPSRKAARSSSSSSSARSSSQIESSRQTRSRSRSVKNIHKVAENKDKKESSLLPQKNGEESVKPPKDSASPPPQENGEESVSLPNDSLPPPEKNGEESVSGDAPSEASPLAQKNDQASAAVTSSSEVTPPPEKNAEEPVTVTTSEESPAGSKDDPSCEANVPVTQTSKLEEKPEPAAADGAESLPEEQTPVGLKEASIAIAEEHKYSGKLSERFKFCTKCSFSCTNSGEFSRHHHQAHNESSQEQTTGAGANAASSARRGTKRKSSSSTPEVGNLERRSPAEKTHRMSEESLMNGGMERSLGCPNEEEEQQSDDGKLVINEESSVNGVAVPVTPTRSGPIQNRTYVCNLCSDYTTNSAQEYLCHQKDTHNENITIYSCDVCDYATKYKQKLPRHRKLHFEGQEQQRNSGLRDPNDSGSSGNGNRMVELEDEEEFPEAESIDEEVESTNNVPSAVPIFVPIPADLSGTSPPSLAKKKGTRQEVDPAKYFEVMDDAILKYACSSCGNIYKWRKSLNKHWKEKHAAETPDGTNCPPGMETLTKQGSIRRTGHRRAIKIGGTGILSSTDPNSPSHGLDLDSRPSTPLGPMKCFLPAFPALDRDSDDGSPIVGHHNRIGPFITNTAQTVSLAVAQRAYQTATVSSSSAHGSLKDASARASGGTDLQMEPLDLSDKGSDLFDRKVKKEPIWDGPNPDSVPQPSTSGVKSARNRPLACEQCDFVGKTSVDYGNHIRTIHNNKKECKCASCGEHFETLEKLTHHFASLHNDEILAYKVMVENERKQLNIQKRRECVKRKKSSVCHEREEIVQKIPHGLQQTYHLIKMPLDDIASLSSQDLNGSSQEARTLKCSMCEYEAKWPADLQKHAVSHSEQRPFACMVCGSTYKWKWDLVKHFEKSHEGLPNPYKRKENSPPKMDDNSSERASPEVQQVGCAESPDPVTATASPQLENIQTNGPLASSSPLPNAGKLSILESSLLSNTPQPVQARGVVELEDIDLASIQIPSVQSIITDVDNDGTDQQRPIAAKTQKAISDAVRNRLNLSVNRPRTNIATQRQGVNNTNHQLTQHCTMCDYKARWPSEITQHMKNHSNEKPHGCPVCSYRSKWKWDVVKHLKRCGNVNGNGRTYTIHDVIDYSKRPSSGPPNVIVNSQGIISSPSVSHPSSVTAVLTSLPAPTSVTTSSHSLQGATPILLASSSGVQDSSPARALQAFIVTPAPAASSASQKSVGKASACRDTGHGKITCAHCTFVASSPAELKRHSVMHSNEKPWVCFLCGYGSRWKCDLKKHVNNYHHQCEENDALLKRPPAEQTCPFCSFQTTQMDVYEQHLKLHKEQGPKGTQGRENQEESKKLACKFCPAVLWSLNAFVDHMKEHYLTTTQRRASPPVDDIDEQRIKHPRKQMKVIQCEECGFKTNLAERLTEHMKEEHSNCKCPFCFAPLTNESFLAHVAEHEEFNPHEWEPYIQSLARSSSMENFEEQASAESIPDSFVQQTESMTTEEQRKTPTGAVKRSHSVLACEWCKEPFYSVVPLYKHCLEMHQEELDEAHKRHLRRTPSPPESQHTSAFYTFPSADNRARSSLNSSGTLPTIVSPKRAINLSSASVSGPPSRGESPAQLDSLGAKKTASSSVGSGSKKRSLQCTKCVFNTFNPSMYLRHMERHNSQSKHTCWFCDYSIDRMNLLYQHMKQVHPIEYQETGQTGKSSSAEGNPDTPGVVSKKEEKTGTDGSVDHKAAAISQTKPTMLALGQATYKGVPVEVMVVNGERRFKCPQCAFLSTDLPATARHVQQHGVPAQSPRGEALNQLTACLASAAQSASCGSPQTFKKMFKCPNCPFTIRHQSVFLTHLHCHGANNTYRCSYCDFSVGDVALLNSHVSVHLDQEDGASRDSGSDGMSSKHQAEESFRQPRNASKKMNATSRVRYWCSICPYNTTCRNNIKKHMKPHLVQSNYRCDLCSYSATRLYLLEQHKSYHDNEPEAPRGPQDVVYDPFENESEVMATANEDDEEAVEEDVDMDEESDLEEGMSKSAGSDLNASLAEKQFRTYKCQRCPFSSNSNGEFKKHSALHGAPNRYRCDYCDYSLDRLNLLTQHRKLHQDEPGFSAGASGSVLINRELYNNSQASASPSASASSSPGCILPAATSMDEFHCHICPYSSTDMKSLSTHCASHGQGKEFTCDYCDWSDDDITRVKQHRLVHRDELGFIVNRDPIVFGNREHAPMDETDDMQELSPFLKEGKTSTPSNSEAKSSSLRCSISPFSADDRSPFESHKQQQQLKGRYKCLYCSFSTGSRAQFDMHLHLHKRPLSSSNPGSLKKRPRHRCNQCPYSTFSVSLLHVHKAHHNNSAPSRKTAHRDSVETSSLPSPVPPTTPEPDTAPVTLTQLDSSPAAVSKKEEPMEVEMKCPGCPFRTTSKNDLDKHANGHETRVGIKCPECDFYTEKEEAMIDHAALHYPGLSRVTVKLILEGQKSQQRLENGLKMETNNNDVDTKPASQPVTEDKMENAPEMKEVPASEEEPREKQEEETKLEDAADDSTVKNLEVMKVYSCQHCDKDFASKALLRHHLKQHQEDRV